MVQSSTSKEQLEHRKYQERKIKTLIGWPLRGPARLHQETMWTPTTKPNRTTPETAATATCDCDYHYHYFCYCHYYHPLLILPFATTTTTTNTTITTTTVAHPYQSFLFATTTTTTTTTTTFAAIATATATGTATATAATTTTSTTTTYYRYITTYLLPATCGYYLVATTCHLRMRGVAFGGAVGRKCCPH